MKITHYCNSFIRVSAGGTRLICDPWIGISSYGGWMTYPITEDARNVLSQTNPTHLYISHIHADHMGGTHLFGENMLTVLDKDIPIYIKNFKLKHLLLRLRSFGFTNITELEPWQAYSISSDLEITIIPCDSTTSDSLEDEVGYDIDTSILVRSISDDVLFYNNVDSPMTKSALQAIRSYAAQQTPRGIIDIACTAVGAAGEYPQTFLDIDRKSEKERIITSSLQSFTESLNILEPECFFPAGGTYIIPGKFSALNDYIAQPSFNQLKNVTRDISNCQHTFDIEGGRSVEKIDGQWQPTESYLPRFSSKAEALSAHQDMDYEYRGLPHVDNETLDRLFSHALENYFLKMRQFKISVNWKVTFNLYENLQLDDSAQISPKSKVSKTYSLRPPSVNEVKYELHCHLDRQLFFGALNGNCNWNLTLSGQIVLYERVPNVHIPTIPFSLNFLVIENQYRVPIQ